MSIITSGDKSPMTNNKSVLQSNPDFVLVEGPSFEEKNSDFTPISSQLPEKSFNNSRSIDV